MLDCRNNDASGSRSGEAEDRHVIRFRTTARKQNLIACHSDRVATASDQQIFARLFHHLASLSPGRMWAARVCQSRLVERSHVMGDARVDQSSRIVIEVDHHGLGPQPNFMNVQE